MRMEQRQLCEDKEEEEWNGESLTWNTPEAEGRPGHRARMNRSGQACSQRFTIQFTQAFSVSWLMAVRMDSKVLEGRGHVHSVNSSIPQTWNIVPGTDYIPSMYVMNENECMNERKKGA